MDERTLRVLEFDKIRTALASQTTFAGGRELAETCAPSNNPIWIEEGLDETQEAVELIEEAGSPPMGGLRDIRPWLRQAQVGAVFQPQQLLDVAYTAGGARRLAEFVQKHAKPEGLLSDVASGIGAHADLEQAILRCIGEDAAVRDHASTKLAGLRSRIRTLQARIRERLESVMRDAAARKLLQEALITLRGGRYVIPVKQEHKSSVPGLVHDQSSSGATVFVEPMPVVQLNNDLRQAESEESEEVERILRELTAQVAAKAVALRRSVHGASRLDFAFAKARLAAKWDCVRPKLNRQGWIDLRQARHPLVGDGVVPIDLWLGREFHTVVITGPNTGGKTVTLKTAGLFVLMAQTGLHIPAAPGTELTLCSGVYADIGDEQSIEQSLSTFSSHMSHIVRILQRADAQSLVLLDELGAGTDPTEGAALAMAILDELTARGCRTVATTHYSELKSYAYTQERLANASVEFDLETLRPTYRLSIGVPGSSNAFAIAERLGLPSPIIATAKERLSVEDQKVEDLIRGVERDRRQAEHDRVEAERLRAEVEATKQSYTVALERLTAQRDAILAQARAEAEGYLKELRKTNDRLIGELRRLGLSEEAEAARAERTAITQLSERFAERKDEHDTSSSSADARHRSDGAAAAVGARVRVQSLGQMGEVVSPPDSRGQITVQIGALRMAVSADEVEVVEGPPARSDQAQRSVVSLGRAKAMHVASELDLRGATADEALAQLDKHLDDASMANLPNLRIIHGKGTGALRHAVQEYLANHPQVRTFRLGDPSEGGTGVTVVEL